MAEPSRQPRVTLRSTCYNQSAFVEQSLDSVARQDFRDIQWIIVDDASTDDSVAKIRGWLGRHQATLQRKGFSIEFYPHETNRGFVTRLNEIVTRARGTFICGLAADDTLLPKRISLGLQTLEQYNTTFAASYSPAYVVDALGARQPGGQYARHSYPTGNIYEHLLHRMFLIAPTVMVRLDALRSVGPYDPAMAFEDYDMWLRVAAQYKFAFCPQSLAEYRLHDGNLHKTVTNVGEQLYWIYRKHVHRDAGRERFLRHFAAMVCRSEVSDRIAGDFRALRLPTPPYVSEAIRQVGRQPGKILRGLLQRLSPRGRRRVA